MKEKKCKKRICSFIHSFVCSHSDKVFVFLNFYFFCFLLHSGFCLFSSNFFFSYFFSLLWGTVDGLSLVQYKPFRDLHVFLFENKFFLLFVNLFLCNSARNSFSFLIFKHFYTSSSPFFIHFAFLIVFFTLTFSFNSTFHHFFSHSFTSTDALQHIFNDELDIYPSLYFKAFYFSENGK